MSDGLTPPKPEWTLAFIGFLAYIFTITTLRFPLGDASVGLGLIGLLTQREKLRRLPAGFWIYVACVAWWMLGSIGSPYDDLVSKRLGDASKMVLILAMAIGALATWGRVHFMMLFYVAVYCLFPVRGTYINYWVYGETLKGRAIWRESTVFGNPNDLGAMTLLILAIALAVLVVEHRRYLRMALWAAVLLMPVLVLMTGSRGVFIGLLFSCMLLLASHRRKLRVLLGLLVAGAVVAVAVPETMWERYGALSSARSTSDLKSLDGDEGSAAERYEIWRVATRIIRENPVTGVGAGAYKAAHQRMARQMGSFARGARDTHSTYLNVLAETGYPGLLLFLSMIVVTLRQATRVRKKYQPLVPHLALQIRYLQLGVYSFLIAGVWGSYYRLSFLYVYLALVWALTFICEREAVARAASLRPHHA